MTGEKFRVEERENPASKTFSCITYAYFLQFYCLSILLQFQILSDVLRSRRTLRRLVHLDLDLVSSVRSAADIDHYGPIGRLSEVAPQLRSLRLNYALRLRDKTKEIVGQVLKIAHNGNLEVWHKKNTIRLCQNLIEQ